MSCIKINMSFCKQSDRAMTASSTSKEIKWISVVRKAMSLLLCVVRIKNYWVV